MRTRPLPPLNYHHLLYFWTVAREGSIARATERLNLSQPAISAQLRTLERSLGEKLFAKRGRNLVLTDVGQLVFRYADEIFTVGRELQETLAGNGTAGRPARLTVGVADALPKILAFRLLEPALAHPQPVRLVLREDKPDRLIADLAIHALDLVLSDAPITPNLRVRAFSHLLGECGVTVFGAPELARRHRARFPQSLDGAPLLLPTENTMLRRSLDAWFEVQGLRPAIVGEIEDSAVLKVFGQAGAGLFMAPSAVEREVQRQYGVRVVGRIDGIRERFYAITVERRITHPVVLAISTTARQELFG
jgi:LysR family transcriptional activator of nhaA